MNTLAGQGFGTRPALARAAVMETEGARTTLSETLLTEAARRMRRGKDTLDVVLIVTDAAEAVRMRLPGLSVVGVVAEQEARAAEPKVSVG